MCFLGGRVPPSLYVMCLKAIVELLRYGLEKCDEDEARRASKDLFRKTGKPEMVQSNNLSFFFGSFSINFSFVLENSIKQTCMGLMTSRGKGLRTVTSRKSMNSHISSNYTSICTHLFPMDKLKSIPKSVLVFSVRIKENLFFFLSNPDTQAKRDPDLSQISSLFQIPRGKPPFRNLEINLKMD